MKLREEVPKFKQVVLPTETINDNTLQVKYSLRESNAQFRLHFLNMYEINKLVFIYL